MRFFILLFFLVHYHFLYSQHSERFTNLVINLIPIDSLYVQDYYSDGSIKSKVRYCIMICQNINIKKTGLWLQYFNNGEIKIKSLYDLEGSISSEMIATLIYYLAFKSE
ncbi:hypothetical protein [Winogradskyella sp. UBA3174]|uniref:hypothetical protein n=1 Tax=Winogradskyella sp. UBA3174 TaxID=1947785 RepID=UPI0025E10372|nr:hypothetical protein [Winogradskyella sp. UBA3174]|tara:strand:- start:24811 stop:25137 length:327 start_codon:yes stop_codon:yes gene_type:complete